MVKNEILTKAWQKLQRIIKNELPVNKLERG